MSDCHWNCQCFESIPTPNNATAKAQKSGCENKERVLVYIQENKQATQQNCNLLKPGSWTLRAKSDRWNNLLLVTLWRLALDAFRHFSGGLTPKWSLTFATGTPASNQRTRRGWNRVSSSIRSTNAGLSIDSCRWQAGANTFKPRALAEGWVANDSTSWFLKGSKSPGPAASNPRLALSYRYSRYRAGIVMWGQAYCAWKQRQLSSLP